MAEVFPREIYRPELDGYYVRRLCRLSIAPGDNRRSANRNTFLRRFRNSWLPHWQGEVGEAVRATNHKSGFAGVLAELKDYKGIEAATSAWINATKYRQEAAETVEALQRYRFIDIDQRAEQLRQDPVALRHVAEHLWAVNSLDQLGAKNYQPHYQDGRLNPVREAELEAVTEEIRNPDANSPFQRDGEILTLLSITDRSGSERLKLWGRLIDDAGNSIVVQEIVHHIKTVASQITSDDDFREFLASFSDDDPFGDDKI